MVTTRRSTANANANRPAISIEKTRLTQLSSDTIEVQKPSRKRVKIIRVGTKVPGTRPKSALSDNPSERDASLTSPITDEVSKVRSTEAPETENISPDRSNPTNLTTVRTLASKPSVSMSGSSHDPIVVNENSSPPRPTVRASKRKRRDRQLPEPHRFIDNGYRNLYNYGVLRPGLPGLPANGSMPHNHQSHDTYRTMNMRTSSAPQFSHNTAWGYNAPTVPFQIQYPVPVQTFAQQYSQPSFPTVYAPYQQIPIPPTLYPVAPSPHEELLRKKVVEYTRSLPRTSPHQQRRTNTNPDDTTTGGSEQFTTHIEPATRGLIQIRGDRLSSTPQSNSLRSEPVTPQPQPTLNIPRLIECTSLMTSLLQIYPHSTNQEGLQKDIQAMLAFLNQHMAAWSDSKSQDTSARKKRDTTNATSPDTQPTPTPTLPPTALNEHDKRLRQVFSAKADMWQDGTGHGVADVYGVAAPTSPSVASFPPTRDNPDKTLSNPVQQRGSEDKNLTTHAVHNADVDEEEEEAEASLNNAK
ncbi:hypothetical protein ACJQWK_06261 [Exserohilum turcicum]